MNKKRTFVIFLLFFIMTLSQHLVFIHAINKATPRVCIVSKLIDNFHAVEDGVIYRSKQLSAPRLSYYIKKFGIKTIVNLRGAMPDELWWHLEKQTAELNNVHFFNLAMSAYSFPSEKNITKLITIYAQAPRPILIHCLGGADRTGEAAALWCIIMQKKSIKKSLSHLTAYYRHLEYWAPKKRRFIKMIQAHLQK